MLEMQSTTPRYVEVNYNYILINFSTCCQPFGYLINIIIFFTQRFAAVIMRIRDPRTTALIFSSGKMVCTGAKRYYPCYSWPL